MIGPILALVLALPPDLCAPIELAREPDPAGAAAYRMVGDAETLTGARETAAAAYRMAAALDPSDMASRAALRALCAQPPGEQADPFRRGLDLMDRGELKEAAAAFRKAQEDQRDASAALLEGVCRYRLGDDAAALAALRLAEEAPEVQDSARFYLGLIALREGDSATAAPLFDALAANSGYGTVAADMALLARRSGRFTVSALATVGWNSNLTAAPSGYSTSGASDGSASIAASGLWRPQGESGPYLRASGAYQQQFNLTAFDIGSASGAGGWQLGHADRAIVAEYAYTFSVLGGAPYLSTNRILASGWLTWGDFTLTGTYLVRFESYRSIYQPFSGTLQWAEARGAWWLGPFARLGISYRLGADGVELNYLSWFEHGPHADFYAQLGPSFRVGLEASLGFRTYGAVAPGPGVVRTDTVLSGAALAEYDLGNHWAAQVSLAVRQAFSNLRQFSSVAFAPSVGIAYLAGF
jgi:tetratricopeptide (TPR) repeat protein